jgi:hypothetical protein
MHPEHVTPELIKNYGQPTVLNLLGYPIVNFPTGQPRHVLAKEFALANELLERKAQEMYAQALKEVGGKPELISQETWEAIGIAEGLDPLTDLAPGVKRSIEALEAGSRLAEFSFDQQVVNTLQHMFRCVRDNRPGVTCNPLLMGAPGASKTQVAIVTAAALGRPIYVVTGGDGAADEIKAQLMGGPFPADRAPWMIAKENASIGSLETAGAKRKLISLLKKKPFEAITAQEWQGIAEAEGYREGITYMRKGAYQLARENGGILLLEEVNSYPAEVHSLLTEILENYGVDGRAHPNFQVFATMNPASEKHPSRNPLPPEVMNRMEPIRVEPPTREQYYQSMKTLLTGEQPLVEINGKKIRVQASMLGKSVPPPKRSRLAELLTSQSLDQLLSNLATFHKAIEEKIESGVLNPKEAEEPTTYETIFYSRRNIKRLLNGIETRLAKTLSTTQIRFSSLTLEDFLKQAEPHTSQNEVCMAIYSALVDYYVLPLTFKTTQKLETQSGGKTTVKHKITSTGEVVKEMLSQCKLSIEELQSYITTNNQTKEAEKEFKQRFIEFGGKPEMEGAVLNAYNKLNAGQKETVHLLNKKGIATIGFVVGPNPEKHAQEVCPDLMADGTNQRIGETIIQTILKRSKDMEKRGLVYPTIEEIKENRDWVSNLRKTPGIYAIPAYTDASRSRLCLIVSVEKSLLQAGKIDPDSEEGKKAAEEMDKGGPYKNFQFNLFPAIKSNENNENQLLYSLLSHLKDGVSKDNKTALYLKASNAKVSLLEIALLDPELVLKKKPANEPPAQNNEEPEIT